jgi:hypothetical protein
MIEIVKVEQDGRDGILVTFSDGTIDGYVVEELLELRPIREVPDIDREMSRQTTATEGAFLTARGTGNGASR